MEDAEVVWRQRICCGENVAGPDESELIGAEKILNEKKLVFAKKLGFFSLCELNCLNFEELRFDVLLIEGLAYWGGNGHTGALPKSIE